MANFSRRSFLALAGLAGAGALVVSKIPGLKVFEQPLRIYQRKMYGRIRITKEMLDDAVVNGQGAFMRAYHSEVDAMIKDIARREEQNWNNHA